MNDIVTRIHNDFDSAQGKLLQEAKRIIESYKPNDKAERLKNIGFVSHDLVVEHEKKTQLLIETKEQAELVEYYKTNYPFQKFLTEEQLNAICKKYNLIYAPIANYKKDVPEKNLQEIECAPPLKYALYPEDIKWCELKRDNSFCLLSGSGGGWCGIWGKEWYRIPKKIEGEHFGSKYQADDYLKNNLGFKTDYLVKRVSNHIFHKDGLFIAAPKSHFNLKGLKSQGQYGMLKSSFTIIEPKDPIVFRYCKGGLQVITKWGDEASDEIVVNEKMN